MRSNFPGLDPEPWDQLRIDPNAALTRPDVEMGNGLFPTDAGSAPNATLCDVDAAAWVCWVRDMQSLGPNYPPYYDIRRTGFGITRYGGPGL